MERKKRSECVFLAGNGEMGVIGWLYWDDPETRNTYWSLSPEGQRWCAAKTAVGFPRMEHASPEEWEEGR